MHIIPALAVIVAPGRRVVLVLAEALADAHRAVVQARQNIDIAAVSLLHGVDFVVHLEGFARVPGGWCPRG